MAYITNSIPNINLRKLLKLVYLIDEKFMESRGFPLTWFDYYAWEKGPVAPEIYEIKNGAFSDYVKCFKNEDNSLWSIIIKEKNVTFVDGKSEVQIPLTRLNEGNFEKEETYNETLEYMQFCDTI